MAIDFPASPTLNDVFTVGNVTYVWDGTKWTASVTGGISLDKIEEGNTSAEVIDTSSDGRFVVTTEGTERLRVTNTGLVGIGTNSPSNTAGFGQQVEIAGTLPCLTLNQNNAGFTTRKYSLAVNAGGAFGIWDNTPSAYRLYINTSGNVGIGTTSPSRQLDVNSTAIFDSNGNGTTTSPSIAIGSTGVGLSYIGSQQLAFLTNSTERLRITSAGLVGIGTSSPTELLAVSGAIKYGSTGYIADGDLGFIYTGSNNNTYGTVIGTKPGTTYSTRRDFTVSLNPANGSGREVFRIEGQGGRVGIGTTPDRTLTVNGIVKSAGRGTSFGYELPDWRIYNSSTGNALVFDNYTTEAFRVDSSNRLLVGTSSGSGNNLLQVQGESGSSAGIGGMFYAGV
jgi:hypothetical protein